MRNNLSPTKNIPRWILDRVPSKMLRPMLMRDLGQKCIIDIREDQPVRILYDFGLEIWMTPDPVGMRAEVFMHAPAGRDMSCVLDAGISINHGFPQRTLASFQMPWERLVDIDAGTTAERASVRANIRAVEEELYRGVPACIAGAVGNMFYFRHMLGGIVITLSQDYELDIYAICGKETRDWTDETFLDAPTSVDLHRIESGTIQDAIQVLARETAAVLHTPKLSTRTDIFLAAALRSVQPARLRARANAWLHAGTETVLPARDSAPHGSAPGQSPLPIGLVSATVAIRSRATQTLRRLGGSFSGIRTQTLGAAGYHSHRSPARPSSTHRQDTTA